MSNLKKAKEIVKEYYSVANCGIFSNRNFIGDVMNTIYKGEGLMIDICYSHAYFEVFGLSDADFKELKTYYHSLGRKQEINTESSINTSEDLYKAVTKLIDEDRKKQKSDVLDKIRLEIASIDVNGQVDEHTMFVRTGEQVKQIALNIIDKMKAVESEE